jgi:hypothetical protein
MSSSSCWIRRSTPSPSTHQSLHLTPDQVVTTVTEPTCNYYTCRASSTGLIWLQCAASCTGTDAQVNRVQATKDSSAADCDLTSRCFPLASDSCKLAQITLLAQQSCSIVEAAVTACCHYHPSLLAVTFQLLPLIVPLPKANAMQHQLP